MVFAVKGSPALVVLNEVPDLIIVERVEIPAKSDRTCDHSGMTAQYMVSMCNKIRKDHEEDSAVLKEKKTRCCCLP